MGISSPMTTRTDFAVIGVAEHAPGKSKHAAAT
jgi:hypothetical protein